MKNDKSPTPQISDMELMPSTAFTLQRFKKEEEKKEAAEESLKVRCRTCFREVAPKPLCFGHGGGGGASSSECVSEPTPGRSKKESLITAETLATEHVEWLGEFGATGVCEEASFNADVIAEFVAQGLVLVDHDRDLQTLTVRLLCEPGYLDEEQKEEFNNFLNAIAKEFDAFKTQHHLTDDCLTWSQDRLSLRIGLPTLALYDAFIEQLANNLVPRPKPSLRVNDEHQALGAEEVTSHTELAVTELETEEPTRALFNPSPSPMKMMP